MASFLEFICRRTLEGKARAINEQQIGIHVFSRSFNHIPHLEALLETTSVGGNAPEAQPIAYRIIKP